MSDSGGILVACIAAPLLLVVLLVAGVSYLVLQAAKLTGRLALEGLHFAGTALAQSIRVASATLHQAGTLLTAAGTGVTQWSSSLFDSAQAADRLRSIAHVNYERALRTLTTTDSPPTVTTIRSISGVTGRPVAQALSSIGKTGLATSAHEQLARAQAIDLALQAEVPLRLVAEQRSATELRTARASMTQAQQLLRDGRLSQAATAARHAEALLSVAARTAHDRLATAERTTITAVVGNAMTDLGYEVRAAAADHQAAVVGRKEHVTAAIVVGSGGRLEIDMAGYEGEACDRESKALVDALRKHGLVIAEACLSRHGRPEGGALIRAARKRGKTLELALAEMSSAPRQEMTDVPAGSGPVRRMTRQRPETQTEQRAVAWVWQQQQVRSGGGR